MSGPLEGLRVVDNTDDSGRFATKLLVGMGADVVRVSTSGSPGNPMSGPAADRGGVLDWWYDGGKRRIALDLDDHTDRDRYRRLTAAADLVVDTAAPGLLAGHGVDHRDLLADNESLVQVSLTPFGRTGPRAHWSSSDLVSAALGGVMSVTGLADRPLNVWGRQVHNYAGLMGTICGLAGVRAARCDGVGRHVDLSIHELVTGSIENIFMQWFFDDVLTLPKLARRQGALHWLRAYDLAQCRTGYVMITPTPTPELLIEWMLDDGFADAGQWQGLDPSEAIERVDEIMEAVRRWVRDHDAMQLWWDAQEHHVAFGGVHDVPAVARIPQFAHRQFWADTPADGTTVRQPARLVHFSGGDSEPAPPPAEDTSVDALLADWGARRDPAAGAPLGRPLEGIRVADLTWVLAGPFATRMLGDLGADVIRIQNEERSTLVNSPDFPYYFVWNRSKRSATLNMKHPDALTVVRRLIENCDILIENYSAGVLDRWGLDWDTVHSWNPRLVYVTMSGCGHDGPWSHVISYAPTVHAVCGITHLTNFEDRGDVGPGFSLNDHLAGFAAATTALAALHRRDETGTGEKIDMAQLEVGTFSIGPALIDHFANGHDARPHGNRDGLQDHVPNEVYPAGDGHVAVTVTDETQWLALVGLLGRPELADPELAEEATRRARRNVIDDAVAAWIADRTADEAMETLQAAGVPAGKVQHAGQLDADDPQLRSRGFWVDVHHDVFGNRRTDTFPALWDGERLVPERLSPAYLGEHNFDVWTELAALDFDQVAEGIGGGLFG